MDYKDLLDQSVQDIVFGSGGNGEMTNLQVHCCPWHKHQSGSLFFIGSWKLRWDSELLNFALPNEVKSLTINKGSFWTEPNHKRRLNGLNGSVLVWAFIVFTVWNRGSNGLNRLKN